MIALDLWSKYIVTVYVCHRQHLLQDYGFCKSTKVQMSIYMIERKKDTYSKLIGGQILEHAYSQPFIHASLYIEL